MTVETSGHETEVRAAMANLATALLARDIPTVESLLDPDFTGFDASGVVVSRAAWLHDLATGELTFEEIRAKSIDMSAVDDAVRVHARLTFRARYSRSSYNGTFDCLGMYVKRPDGWKLLVSKARVAPAEP